MTTQKQGFADVAMLATSVEQLDLAMTGESFWAEDTPRRKPGAALKPDNR
jgi:hypothetical protein